MNFGWRIVLIVIVVIAVISMIFIGLRKKSNEEQFSTNRDSNILPSVSDQNMPEATGNIDAVVSSLFSDSDKEISSIYSDLSDSSAVSYDNTEITNFGQSYENNF